MRSASATARPAPGELVPIAERIRYLSALRVAFGLFVLGLGSLAPDLLGTSLGAFAAATGAYLLLALVPEVARGLRRSNLLPLIGATLLLDGIYLAWVTYASGGAQSPLRFLIYLHVVAVTLLGSYRTGLKIAAWHSLLLLVAFYAQSAGFLEVRETIVSALPGRGDDFYLVSMLNVAALWAVALGTAAFSAVNEREIRAQKVDLEHLSAMVADIDNRAEAPEIPEILLDGLRRAFGFERGAVLASPENDLSLMAYRGPGSPTEVPAGLDPIMERAWKQRQTLLVRHVDPEVDTRLAALLPDGRNLLIVPLFLDRDQRLGLVVLEHRGRGDSIKRWMVQMVEQFASHASLALHNAWLLDEIERKLEENRALQRELQMHNIALETTVEERTRELRESLRDLRIVDEHRRKLLFRLVNAEEDERRRIAADIHDGPVQEITGAQIVLDALRRHLTDPKHTRTVESTLEVLRTGVEGLRDLLFDLRPTVLDQEGMKPALVHALEALPEGVEFEVEDRLSEEPPPQTRIILYRIAQEALANIRKHAHATRVLITLEEKDEGFLVRVEDDGRGFDPPRALQSAPRHLGLSSMRERAEMAGGWCQVRSVPGRGTTVTFWLPLDAATPRAQPVSVEPRPALRAIS
jgi:signal transduction histidine kinase